MDSIVPIMIDYDPHDWLGYHLFDVKGSMIREIVGRVSACVLCSVVVVAFHKWVFPVEVSPATHTLVGFALGMLLVLRTNASYDRYWEGRRQWGCITNDSRSLSRAAKVLLKNNPELRDQVLVWGAAFPYAVMNRLRGGPATLPTSLGLPPAEVAAIEAASDRAPQAVAFRITTAARSSPR